MINLRYIKEVLLILLFIGIALLYQDRQFQKAEKERQTENARQLRLSDSLRFASQILSTGEIKDYLEYQNKDLKQLLQQSNIREERLQSIVSTTYRYSDTKAKDFDMNAILQAIKENKNLTVPFTDSTKCLTIKGNLSFKNDSMKVTITERNFKNKTDNVVYWQRRQWKFLGIKTRFLGKKEFVAKSFDQCGESKTIKIERMP